MQSGLHAIDAVEHFVDFGGGEIHFVLRVGEGVAVRGIDQHAEGGFVDLHHGDAGLLQFEQLSAEDGHQRVDEFVAGGIGPGRDLFFPQAHAQQIGRRHADFSHAVGRRDQKASFIGNQPGFGDFHLFGD